MNQDGFVFFLLTIVYTLTRCCVSTWIGEIEAVAYLGVVVVNVFEDFSWLQLITPEQVIIYELQTSRED